MVPEGILKALLVWFLLDKGIACRDPNGVGPGQYVSAATMLRGVSVTLGLEAKIELQGDTRQRNGFAELCSTPPRANANNNRIAEPLWSHWATLGIGASSQPQCLPLVVWTVEKPRKAPSTGWIRDVKRAVVGCREAINIRWKKTEDERANWQRGERKSRQWNSDASGSKSTDSSRRNNKAHKKITTGENEGEKPVNGNLFFNSCCFSMPERGYGNNGACCCYSLGLWQQWW